MTQLVNCIFPSKYKQTVVGIAVNYYTYLCLFFRWMDVLTKASMTDDQQAAVIVGTKQSIGIATYTTQDLSVCMI